MAVSTTTNLSNSMRRTYADRWWRAFERTFTPILDELDEAEDKPALGSGWFFPFTLALPHGNWRVNAEAGTMGTTRQRSEIQGQVNPVEFLAWLQISELLKNVGTGAGAFGNELNRQMKETTAVLTMGLQRMLTLSHGTGRLAVVLATTTGTSFTCKGDEFSVGLMDEEYVDEVDVDTASGTVTNSGVHITDVNRRTHVVTVESSATFTANSGIYKTGDFGRGVNGLHGLIDDGTFQDSLHGQSRTTYPKLKAQIRDPGTPELLTEEKMRQLCDDIHHAGGAVDKIWCNTGVMNAYFDIMEGDSRYIIEGGKTAKRVLGYKTGDAAFDYHDSHMVLQLNLNIPARTMYFLSIKNGFRKHTVKKLGWLDEGGSILRLTPQAGGFETSWTALMLCEMNISCFAPPWQGALRNVLDKGIAGDS